MDFMKMEAQGIFRWSSSPWASPLPLVKNPDGSWQVWGDFCHLNNVAVLDTNSLPNFSARVTGCKLLSKIDLRKGYFQIFMHPDDIPKTAVITPFGLFEFLRPPFGLRNARKVTLQGIYCRRTIPINNPYLRSSFSIFFMNHNFPLHLFHADHHSSVPRLFIIFRSVPFAIPAHEKQRKRQYM